MAHIHSVLTDVPPYTLTQMEFYDYVAPDIMPRLQNIFKRILNGSQIRKRHFSTPIKHMIEMTRDKKIEDKFLVWKEASMEYWTSQTEQLLLESGLSPDEIDGICTSTTSGFITVSVLVSNSIFSDGFAALLMVGKDHKLASTSQIEMLNTKSHIFPDCDFAIGQWMTDEGLHTHIDAKLPKLINESVKEPLDVMFKEQEKAVSDVDYWICHAGGPKVMEAFGDSLALSDSCLETTMETYRDYGNQSSVSVITALEKTFVQTM